MSKRRVNRAIDPFLKLLLKLLRQIFKQISQLARAIAKGPVSWLLRRVLRLGRQPRQPRRQSDRNSRQSYRRNSRRQLRRQMAGGFVLPTVTMIILVVILVVSAITIRSFDRANNAQLIRASEESISAAKPALDRANAKISFLLNGDPTIPRATPSDLVLYQAMTGDAYTFGDEVRLSVRFDLDGNNNIELNGDEPAANDPDLDDNEEITTAWRYPVDTDSNGKFDSFTLYGIYFRSPQRDPGTGEFSVPRSPLDARTPPMPPTQGANNAQCAGALATSASLVGASSWYQSQGVLQKSIYVFTATIPITDTTVGLGPSEDPADFEIRNSTTFSGLEYQQDRSRVPLLNNAVVYEDDLEIASGAALRLNGRMITNSNLILTHFGNGVFLYQVSGLNSCYYSEDNAKIIVGGNVVNGWTSDNQFRNAVTVHLYDPATTATSGVPTTQVDNTNQSVTETPLNVIYNNDAYAQRINLLTNAQVANPAASDPTLVSQAVTDRLAADSTLVAADVRREELQSYFLARTRRVPFREVADGANALGTFTTNDVLQGSGDSLRPPDDWVLPTGGDATTGATNGPTNLTINPGQLQATEPDVQNGLGIEQFLGDRILVGNNLPPLRWNGTQFVGEDAPQQIDGTTTWDTPTGPSTVVRTRTTRVADLANAGDTGRFGFWEKNAGQQPQRVLDGVGGLRVVTGAGVYERLTSFLPPPPDLNAATTAPANPDPDYDDPATTVVEQYPIVWPDTMPMSPGQGSQVFNNDPAAPPANLWDDPVANPAHITLGVPPIAAANIDPNTAQYAKGDLRMRATAVYHYAEDPYDPANGDTNQAPLACISSYYDPTNSATAQNMAGLPWNAAATGASNNGIVYPPPATARPGGNITLNAGNNLLESPTSPNLVNQANLVFPDGRFANEPLRNALVKLANGNPLDLADQSAIDSTLCAMDILSGGITPSPSPPPIPHGAIREVAFLDARQIKAIDADNPATNGVDETFTLSSPLATTPAGDDPAQLTGRYDLDLEERQPLEIRATQLDINQLRNQTIAFAAGVLGPAPEYLLPNSGIIYATRDDALPDRSSRPANAAGDAIDEDSSALLSPTDSRVDPSRRPNGIMLINGDRLARNDSSPNDGQNDTAPSITSAVTQIVQEKGLILASDLPVYIKGNFNVHTQEEFTAALNTNTWGNFYTRPTLNPNFACRVNDPRLPSCTTGDSWRPATVLADAVTLLSDRFDFGFRNEGDFDLRNNAGIVTYDLNNNGNNTDAAVPLDETALGMDLNSNGNQTDAAVNLNETEVPANVARRLNGFYANNFATNGLSSGDATGAARRVLDTNRDGTVTNADPIFTDARYNQNTNSNVNGNNPRNSSYFNNFVTPVQRRGNFPEYIMEICRKLPVSACESDDWVVGYDSDGEPGFYDTVGNLEMVDEDNITGLLNGLDLNWDGDKNDEIPERDIKAHALVAGGSQIVNLGAGTTARPPIDPADQRYPRRVAFLRYPAGTLTPNALVLDPNGLPIALGNNGGAVSYYPYADTSIPINADLQFDFAQRPQAVPPPAGYVEYSAGVPDIANNALWFRTTNGGAAPDPTTNDNYGSNFPLFYRNPLTETAPGSGIGTVQQPLLVPVLQIQTTTATPAGNTAALPNPQNGARRRDLRQRTRWRPRPIDTQFNLVIGSGDTPSRALNATTGDYNGGMQNLPRLLESWRRNNVLFTTTIFGSFVQLGRSKYATAPFQPIRPDLPQSFPARQSIFNYRQIYNSALGQGKTPFFAGSNRNWGFDVGLLSQPPDLFAQTFTLPPANDSPNEFFREVSRDDDWIETLLCARLAGNPGVNAVPNAQRPTSFCTNNTGG